MTQEDKALLLKDLCARVPYGVEADCVGEYVKIKYIDPYRSTVYISNLGKTKWESIEVIKPYLRSISSMTDDKMDRLFDILRIDKDGNDEDWIKINDVYGIKFFFPTGKWIEDVAEAYAYLYSIHIDFRGLIRKELAIEAPEGMYLY